MAVSLTLVALLGACRKPEAPKPPPRAGEPQVHAVVVSIQTSVEPGKKAFAHTITIAGDRARSSDELDQWRLFDLKNNRVVYVDDIAKTFRSEAMATILARRRAAAAAALPEGVPHVTVSSTAAQRPLQGVQASQLVIRAGRYVRELWIGAPASIPPSLFPMMYASEPVTSPLAPMTRTLDEAMFRLRGFPLAEHAELPVGAGKMVLDRSVVKIEKRDVPERTLNVPAGYKDITPKPAARARKR